MSEKKELMKRVGPLMRARVMTHWWMMRIYAMPLGTYYWAKWRMAGLPFPWGMVTKASLVAMEKNTVRRGALHEAAKRILKAAKSPGDEDLKNEGRMAQVLIWMVGAMRGGNPL